MINDYQLLFCILMICLIITDVFKYNICSAKSEFVFFDQIIERRSSKYEYNIIINNIINVTLVEYNNNIVQQLSAIPILL